MRFLAGILLAPTLMAQIFYVGTYTDAKSKGIYAFEMDPSSGRPVPLGLMAETPSPSFLAWHPSGKFLYAVNEAGKGSVTAFSVNATTHQLKQLNQQPSEGDSPCHLAIDHTGKMLTIANYGGGSVVSYPIAADGSLGPPTSVMQHKGSSINPERQSGPHAHSTYISADNRFLYSTDLGLDKVFRYSIDPSTAKLTETSPTSFAVKPGSGPRHMAFSHDGAHAFVINEMGNTVTVLNMDRSTGDLREFQSVSTLPPGFSGENTTAEIQLDESGKFLYGSNRGADNIAVFQVGPDGALKLIQNVSSGGVMPRFFTLDPSGKFLLAANQKGNNIVVFQVDATTGKLKETGNSVEISSPVCLLFLPK